MELTFLRKEAENVNQTARGDANHRDYQEFFSLVNKFLGIVPGNIGGKGNNDLEHVQVQVRLGNR